MKKILIIVLLAVFSVSQAQNIAYLNNQKVLDKLPNYTENLKKIDELKGTYNKEISEALKALAEKTEVLFAKYNIAKDASLEDVKKAMTELDASKLDLLIKDDELIKSKAKNYDLALNSEFKSTVQPLINGLQEKIKKYAKKHDIDAIYNINSAAGMFTYLNEEKDITEDIIGLIE